MLVPVLCPTVRGRLSLLNKWGMGRGRPSKSCEPYAEERCLLAGPGWVPLSVGTR